jgi:hypothetical protein
MKVQASDRRTGSSARFSSSSVPVLRGLQLPPLVKRVCSVVLAWVLTGSAAIAAGAPSLKAVGVHESQVVLEAQVPGYQTEVVKRGSGRYTIISLPECGFSTQVGEPQLPVIRRLIEVPEGAQLSAEIQADAQPVRLSSVGINCPVLPRQPPVPKIAGAAKAAPFQVKASAYQADAFGPSSRVALAEAGRFAGRRLVLVEVSPITYNPVRGELSVASRLTVKVSIKGGAKALSGLSASEDAWLTGLTVNHSASGRPKVGGRLLIIADNSFVPYLGAFVSHKASLGWTVDLVSTSTAGTVADAIRSYIQSRYADLGARPSAVLLVGDTAQIPCFVSSLEDNPDTDLYYGCMDPGDDWQPELPVGRFSVSTLAQLDAVINKTIDYETSSPGPWALRAAFMASDDSAHWRLAEGTHDWCISNYLEGRSYVSDKLYAISYGANTAQVRDSLNDGRVFGIYSGHGSESGWAGPAFSGSDVQSLANVGKYPFVCSFACLTGRYSQSECFAETWQRGANYGGVEVLASSVYSYWDEDDVLQRKLFTALFDQNHWLFGDNVMQAKYLYLQFWGATETTRRYFEQYNVFGDPTVALKSPSFCIASTSPLAAAFRNEPYSFALAAAGGTQPYTWSIKDGALPPGLALDPASGLISGTPTNIGTATVTVQVADATLATTNRVLQLPVLVRLQVASATNLAAAALNAPYATALLAQGGTPPYHWSANLVGGYAERDPGSGWLGDGTAKDWHADDGSWSLALPWAFPFYGINRTSVWICSNGFLDFASTNADYSNSDPSLENAVRIAPLWEDLVTTGPGDDIYVTATSSYVAVRWAAHTYSGGYPVNVEVVLYPDGTIQFNYGAAHSGLPGATIGLSAGDGAHYALSTRDNATSIPEYVSSRFGRTGLLPPGLALADAGLISGAATQLGNFTFVLHLADSGVPSQSLDQQFSLPVIAAPSITSFSYDRTNNCLVTFNTITGRVYIVECSPGVSATNLWFPVSHPLSGTGEPVCICDADAGLSPQRFYRVRMW